MSATNRMFMTMVSGMALSLVATSFADEGELRRIPVDEYRDRMSGGWIGQMAGVGWGGPTEFRWKGEIIPAGEMPAWRPELINQFRQDDLYVEMTFLRTLETRGWDVSLRDAGIDFARSEYPLWHANRAGRDNLRAGIAPPRKRRRGEEDVRQAAHGGHRVVQHDGDAASQPDGDQDVAAGAHLQLRHAHHQFAARHALLR